MTSSLSPRPSVFVMGAPKCGTTAVTRYLEAHPEVFVAERKDIHFFGSDLQFRNRPRETEADYLARFSSSDARNAKVCAESSVWYLYSQNAAAEMRAFSSDARGIVLLRHPVDAMYALWTQLRLNGLGDEPLDSFAEALAAEHQRAQGVRIPQHTPLPEALLYRKVMSFSGQLARVMAELGPGNVHVIIQEEMRADTPATLALLYAWLGVSPFVPPSLREVNTHKTVRSETVRALLRATPESLKALVPTDLRKAVSRLLRSANARHATRTPLDPALRAQLTTEMAGEIARVEAVLGRPIPAWHSKSAVVPDALSSTDS